MKRLILLLLIVILVPQIAFAAWWNPFSWFSKPNVEQEKTEPLNRLVELEEKANSQDVASSTVQESPKLEVKEKIITQTITVDNPELQKRISALITENIALQIKVNSQSSLVQQLNSCKADLVGLKGMTAVNTIGSVDEQIKDLRTERSSLDVLRIKVEQLSDSPSLKDIAWLQENPISANLIIRDGVGYKGPSNWKNIIYDRIRLRQAEIDLELSRL